MDDLVARLHEHFKGWGSPVNRDEEINEGVMAFDCNAAADEIERLRAENAALRAVMRNVIDWSDDYIDIKLREEMGAARKAQQPEGG